MGESGGGGGGGGREEARVRVKQYTVYLQKGENRTTKRELQKEKGDGNGVTQVYCTLHDKTTETKKRTETSIRLN